MIATLRLTATGKTVQDGKEVSVNLSPAQVLYQVGPVIDVTITQPSDIQKQYEEEKKEVASITTRAMIDTGASTTVITPRIAESAQLIHTGYRKVSSVHDKRERPVYYGLVMFPALGGAKALPLVSCELKRFDCLIGRDILMHWHFTYNGRDGSIVVCD